MKNTVMYMLEENARRTPEKTALADEYAFLTYRGYLEAALQTAFQIRQILGKKHDGDPEACAASEESPVPETPVRCRPVGVWIDRNILSVAAFMGIAYSGNFYVPLDPALPAGRLSVILQELDPVMLIDARQTPGEMPVPFDGPVLTMQTVLENTDPAGAAKGNTWTGPETETSGESTDGENADGENTDGENADREALSLQTLLRQAESLRAGALDTDPLYAIFTSGSTGIPKGVLIAHRSVLDLTEAFAEVFSFAEDAVFGNQAPFDFDVSVKDIYNALHCGGRVEIIPHRMFVMPATLMEYLAVRGINTVIWAVSALRIVSDLRALDEMKTSVPVQLRHVMFSGEVMPVKSVRYWKQFFPDTVFVNLYGPTEITCNCTFHILNREYGADELLPIGRAFPNTRVFLLEMEEEGAEGMENESGAGKDSRGQRVIAPSEHGRRGEICVEGTGVALGYWNNPARTAESFTAMPGAPATLNRIYRTGDMGYYNTEGELVFAARADNQIKHMGHRIELGEIEASLNAIDFLDVSCCFYDHKKEKIVCVYQAPEDVRRQIIAALSDRLPKYMRPNKYLRMDSMPLNAHAKIDRRLLRSMYEEGKLK